MTARMRWRRLDVPGHDACELQRESDGWLLHGVAIFLHAAGPARLDYRVRCDDAWRTREAEVHGWVGPQSIALFVARSPEARWTLNGDPVVGLDGCVDVDFGFTPATNLAPLRRIALDVGAAGAVPVAWLDVPAGRLSRLEQRYERIATDRYRYEAPRFAYREVLEVNDDGFVRRYPGLWEAESAIAAV